MQSNMKIKTVIVKVIILIVIFTQMNYFSFQDNLAKGKEQSIVYLDENTFKNPLPIIAGYEELQIQNNIVYIESTYAHPFVIYNLSDNTGNLTNLYKEYDFNFIDAYFEIRGNYLFYGSSSYQIWDITDLSNISYLTTLHDSQIAFGDIFVENDTLTILGAYQLVNRTFMNVILTYKITNDNDFVSVSNYSFIDYFKFKSGVKFGKNLFLKSNEYVDSNDRSKIVHVELVNNTHLAINNSLLLNERVISMINYNDHLYLARKDYGLSLVDTETFTITKNFTDFHKSGFVNKIQIDNNIAYLLKSQNIAVINITNLSDITLICDYTIKNQGIERINDISLVNNQLYAACNNEDEKRALIIIDFTDSTNPEIVYPTDSLPSQGFGINFNLAYLILTIGIFTFLRRKSPIKIPKIREVKK